MNLKNYQYLPLFFVLLTNFIFSQNHYNDLSLLEKIAVKEGHSSYFTNARLGIGTNPSILTTGPEQDCNSAIPVCQNVYTTSTSYSGVGSNDEIPSNSCLGSNEKNSVWYTFNTSSAGNLAFTINPNSSSDDYDFALYDITGTNCSSIANGALTPIRCNFSATSGLTGLTSSGTNASEPASGSNQSTVLATTIGKTYVLIISNYSSSQSGYTLDFSSGTASIFDVTPPTIIGVTAPCGSSSVVFNASEQIKCSTIAANGSDFTITGTGGPYSVTAASGQNCGVNTAQINLTISPALSGAGPWTVGVKSGSDGNTLVDPCGNIMLPNTHTFTTSPPVVTITGPTSVCKGVVFALTASSATSYTWTGAAVPAGQQNQQTISVTPNAAGTLNFNLTVTNGTCGNSSASQAVTVKEGPTAHFTAAPTTICAGQSVAFTNTSIVPCTTGGSGLAVCNCGSFLCSSTPLSNANLIHTWTFGDPLSGGSNFAIGVNQSHTYNSPGTYYINLNTNFLIGGGCNTSETQTINVLPATPALTVSPTTTICPGQSSTLTALGGTSYTWTPASSLNTSNGGTVIATPTITTTYSVSAPGCSGNQTSTVQVIVGGTPPAIGAISGPTVVCPHSTGNLYSVNNVVSTNYTWAVPAGATITSTPTNSNAISVNFGATVGTVSVSAIGTCGTSTAVITISLSPALNITVTPNVSSICAGGSTNLTASGATNYTWSPSASLSSANGTSVTASPTSATTYTVIGSTGTCTGSATANVTMATGLTLTLTANTPTVCPGASVLLDANGATTYSWFPSSTLSSPVGSNVTATPLSNTIYTVVGSAGTCTGVATISVGIGACVSSACNVALIRSTLTAAGNIELLGMNNSCSLYFINPQYMTGPQAQAYAQTFGANLISVQSATENADLVQALSNQGFSSNVIWIGFSDAITEGSFIWYDGAPITYSNWAPGEPNNAGGNENCTQIYPNGSWNDLNCVGYNSLSVIEVNICPQVTVSSAPIHCAGTNVSLNASTLLGSPGYTYTWVQSAADSFTNTSTAGNTDQITITSLSANTFTVYSEDRYACPQSAIVTLSVNPLPTITVNSSTICAGTQTATLSANGASTYTWSPATGLSSTSGAIVTGNPASSQNYTLLGTDANGCISGTTTAIQVNTLPNISVSPNMTICPFAATTLTASGVSNYTWSPSSSLSSANTNIVTASPTVSTTYTVNGDSGGCIGTQTISVGVTGNGFPPNVYIIQKNSLCDTTILNWLNITSVTPTLAQGNLPSGLTVNATHSGGGMSTTPSMFSGASFPTSYSVPIASTTIRNDLGGTFNFCFNQPVINPQIAFASIGQVGLPITINTSTPYQVLWAGTNMTYSNPMSLIGEEGFTIIRFPGIHTCVSLDYIGNESYCNLAFGVMDAACQGQPICPNQPIELVANGATSYTWSSGATSTTITPTPSITTSYSVIGVTPAGCSNTSTTTVVVYPSPTITVNSSTICVGQQTATLTANGASTYTWAPAVGLSATTGSIVTGNPVASQIYTISGTDTNGCLADTTTNITVNTLPIITVNNSTICVGQQTATLTANGATTYSWIPGTGLSATTGSVVTGNPTSTQNYTLVGMDNNGCINGTITAITVNTLPTITVNNSTICVGQQTATLTANGGATYNWLPSTGLSATTGSVVTGNPTSTQNYTIVGIDANGCFNDTTSTITVNSLPIITTNASTICVGQGTATLTANGASTYSWMPGTGLSSTTASFVTGNPSSTQNYTLVGMDANGCINGTITSIFVNPLPTIIVNSSTICVGQQTATLNANGASTYTWSPATGLSATNGSMVTGNPTSTQSYTITGIDLNGCVHDTTANIIVNTLPTITVNSATICAAQQTATLTANGANTYSWIPGTGLSSTTTSVVTGNPSSTQNYTVIGMDINGCLNGAITSISVNPTPTVIVNTSSICLGQQTATLTANGASTYSWSPAIGLSATTGSLITGNPSSTQSYSVTGTDLNGCYHTTTTTITVNSIPTITVNSPSICLGQQTATLIANGSLIYNWTPSTGLSTTTGSLVTGTPTVNQTYSVSAMDINGCISGTTATITVNPLPTVTVNSSTICSSQQGATLTANGANTYNWTPNIGLSSTTGSVINGNPSSTQDYTVVGTDINGCVTTKTLNVFVIPTPTINATGSPLTICAGNTISLTASGSLSSSYTWSPSGSIANVNNSNTTATPAFTTTYTVVGSNGAAPNLCISSKTLQIVVIQNPTITISPQAIICEGQHTTIYAGGANQYKWTPTTDVHNPFDSVTVVSPVTPIVYTVTGTTNNCSSTATVNVMVNPLPIINAGRDTTINIDNTVTLVGIGNTDVGFITASDGTPFTCNYCPTVTVNPQNSTCYVLEGISPYGCRSVDEVCVTVTKDWDVFIPNAFTPNGDLTNEIFVPMGYGISEIKLTIFDRWGATIFKSNGETVGWDGTNKGKPCEQGVYIYQADITAMSGVKVKKTGHVTLISRVK